MKQAFEAGDAAPETNPASPASKTPSKTTRKKVADASENDGTPTLKRKRASPKKKAVKEEEGEIKPDDQEDGKDEEMAMQTPTKKPKVARSKAASKAKVEDEVKAEHDGEEDMSSAEAPMIVKKEVDVEDDADMDNVDNFVDAQQWVNELVGGMTEDDGSEV
jgi:hypothetical protein